MGQLTELAESWNHNRVCVLTGAVRLTDCCQGPPYWSAYISLKRQSSTKVFLNLLLLTLKMRILVNHYSKPNKLNNILLPFQTCSVVTLKETFLTPNPTLCYSKSTPNNVSETEQFIFLLTLQCCFKPSNLLEIS